MVVRFEVKLAAEVAALNPVSRIAAIDIITSEWYKIDHENAADI